MAESQLLNQPRPQTNAMPFHVATNVLFAVVALIVLAAAATYAGLQIEGYRLYKVSTGSMEPSIGQGSVIAVHQTPPHEIGAGDVIAFTHEGQTVIHRVVSVRSAPDFRAIVKDQQGNITRESVTYAPRSFVTKGDANETPDTAVVTQDQLLGEKRFLVPWPLNLIATQVSKSALIAIGGAGLVAFFAWEAFDAISKRRKQRAAAAERDALTT
ncbi:MAG TPA: signal peptidase I [Dehalococcoidia bacterium]|nr:signal peptidase I [Dehalococcoidia bacterium]